MKKWIIVLLLLLLSGCQAHQDSERIVSLMPSNTEILYEMGLGDKVVGVTTNDDYPADVHNKEKFDGFNLNKEQLLRVKPSLIVTHESARTSQQKVLDALEKKGIKVVYIKEAKRIEDIDDTIMQVAEAAGHKKEGQKVAEQLNQEIAAVKQHFQHLVKRKIFIEVSSEPDIYTAGRETLFDDMLTQLGMENVFHDLHGWQPVALETVVRRQPDVMVSTTGISKEVYVKKVKGRPGLDKTKVITLNDDWITRPGPRMAKGLEELAKALDD
ncbi:ABC transporter substrate-binding protein [Macrococcus hajekii]|nr:ABC transporter substrate-binding protein [Macrococcus hajekii]GGB11874.1 ABC transporter substrate-binding protein [Macrococcus hajekii]